MDEFIDRERDRQTNRQIKMLKYSMWKLYFSGWILGQEFSALGDQNAEITSKDLSSGKIMECHFEPSQGTEKFLPCFLPAMLPATLQEKRMKKTTIENQKDKGVASKGLSVYFRSTITT